MVNMMNFNDCNFCLEIDGIQLIQELDKSGKLQFFGSEFKHEITKEEFLEFVEKGCGLFGIDLSIWEDTKSKDKSIEVNL